MSSLDEEAVLGLDVPGEVADELGLLLEDLVLAGEDLIAALAGERGEGGGGGDVVVGGHGEVVVGEVILEGTSKRSVNQMWNAL